MLNIAGIVKALLAGERLTHAAIWKDVQAATNAVAAVLAIGILLLPETLDVSQEDMMAISGGIVAIGGVLNVYFTNATSRKVGMPIKGD